MIEEKGKDFLEMFLNKPNKIFLFGTKGAITMYISYIKILRKHGIEVTAIVSNETSKIGTKILGTRVISYDIWKEQLDTNQYLLLTSSAKRYKEEDLGFIKSFSFSKNIHVWTDFPFKMSFTDFPYPRSWSENSSWFYDVLYAGLDVYDKNPRKYIEEVFQHNGLIVKAGAFYMQDHHSEYVNIVNGERRTLNQPQEYENKVYILGSCIAYGDRCDDSTTIASKLQLLLNRKYGDRYCVCNYAAVQVPINNCIPLLKNLNIQKGDKVIYVDMPRILIDAKEKIYSGKQLAKIYTQYLLEADNYCYEKGVSFHYMCLPFLDDLSSKTNFEKEIEINIPTTIAKYREKLSLLKASGLCVESHARKPIVGLGGITFEKIVLVPYEDLYMTLNDSTISYIALKHFFESSHEFVEIYGDRSHMTYMGYQYIGYIIFENYFLKKNYKQDYVSTHKFFQNMINDYILTSDFKEYLKKLEDIARKKDGESGIIVMNCNPFTKGHRYLIETAAKQVDNLYVLVVEEDKSAFKFMDRFEMVKEGVKDLSNVIVLESGKFVISSLTFPEYFTKDTNKTAEFDASKDLYNFCMFIAPALNANKRFVGEEPLDIVTNSYNQQMKRLLPEYDLDLIIIPRKEVEGGVISATRGRRYIAEKNMEGIKLIFPDTTIRYLKEKGFI